MQLSYSLLDNLRFDFEPEFYWEQLLVVSVIQAGHQSCLIVMDFILHQALDLLPNHLIEDLGLEGETDHLVETAYQYRDVGGILNFAQMWHGALEEKRDNDVKGWVEKFL